MPHARTTCWDLIQGSATGNGAFRDEFARRYEPIVRSYLGDRWRRSPALLGRLDDAVQDVFLECFRTGGALERANPASGRFSAFLCGVTRHVAQRAERRSVKEARREGDATVEPDDLESKDPTLSQMFDRAWALAIVQEAARLQAQRARGPGQVRRVELLRLRFEENLPPREIAQRWSVPAAVVHRDYTQALDEFQRSLRDVVAAYSGPHAYEEELAMIMELIR